MLHMCQAAARCPAPLHARLPTLQVQQGPMDLQFVKEAGLCLASAQQSASGRFPAELLASGAAQELVAAAGACLEYGCSEEEDVGMLMQVRLAAAASAAAAAAAAADA